MIDKQPNCTEGVAGNHWNTSKTLSFIQEYRPSDLIKFKIKVGKNVFKNIGDKGELATIRHDNGR